MRADRGQMRFDGCRRQRPENALAISERDPQPLVIRIAQIRQDVQVDGVLHEGARILAQPKALKPCRNLVHENWFPCCLTIGSQFSWKASFPAPLTSMAPIPDRSRPGMPIRRQSCAGAQEFTVDHALDEGSVVNHREMRALPDMDLEPRVSEISPAERMAPRDIRIVARRKAGDGNIPRRLVFIFIVAGHPELRADDRKHDTAQFWIVEQLLGGLDIEVADDPAEYVVGFARTPAR